MKEVTSASSATESSGDKRTVRQNNSIHLYLELVANELDREGHTLQDVTRAIRRAEIRPTKEALKEVVWKPLQEIVLGKKSTTQLETKDVDKIYEIMNKWLGQEFQIHVPFPSVDSDKKELGS